MKKSTLLLVASTLVAMTACSKSGNEPAAQRAPAKAASAAVQQAAPAGHPQIEAVASAPATAATGTAQQGKVLSVTQVPGYTYLQVETGGHKTWMATSPTDVKAGNTVSWNGGIVMHNFASKSLKRTFDKLVLLQHVEIVK